MGGNAYYILKRRTLLSTAIKITAWSQLSVALHYFPHNLAVIARGNSGSASYINFVWLFYCLAYRIFKVSKNSLPEYGWFPSQCLYNI